jgi:hypothetical protein
MIYVSLTLNVCQDVAIPNSVLTLLIATYLVNLTVNVAVHQVVAVRISVLINQYVKVINESEIIVTTIMNVKIASAEIVYVRKI